MQKWYKRPDTIKLEHATLENCISEHTLPSWNIPRLQNDMRYLTLLSWNMPRLENDISDITLLNWNIPGLQNNISDHTSRYYLLPPFCPIKYVSTILVPCFDVRTLRFPYKTMFGSFVSTVVCSWTLFLLCLLGHGGVQYFALSYVFTFLIQCSDFRIKTYILLVFTRICL